MSNITSQEAYQQWEASLFGKKVSQKTDTKSPITTQPQPYVALNEYEDFLESSDGAAYLEDIGPPPGFADHTKLDVSVMTMEEVSIPDPAKVEAKPKLPIISLKKKTKKKPAKKRIKAKKADVSKKL